LHFGSKEQPDSSSSTNNNYINLLKCLTIATKPIIQFNCSFIHVLTQQLKCQLQSNHNKTKETREKKRHNLCCLKSNRNFISATAPPLCDIIIIQFKYILHYSCAESFISATAPPLCYIIIIQFKYILHYSCAEYAATKAITEKSQRAPRLCTLQTIKIIKLEPQGQFRKRSSGISIITTLHNKGKHKGNKKELKNKIHDKAVLKKQ
jgi:hypothetical protein